MAIQHRFHFDLIHHAIKKKVFKTKWQENNVLVENLNLMKTVF